MNLFGGVGFERSKTSGERRVLMKTHLELLFHIKSGKCNENQVGVLSEHFLLLFSRKYFELVIFLILEMLCVI